MGSQCSCNCRDQEAEMYIDKKEFGNSSQFNKSNKSKKDQNNQRYNRNNYTTHQDIDEEELQKKFVDDPNLVYVPEYVYPNGSVYKGQMLQDERHGYGV